MKSRWVAFLGMATLASALGGSLPAWASKSPPETYPAVEGDGYSVPDDSLPDLPAPRPEKAARAHKRKARKSHWAYDTVPRGQIDPVVKRLHLVEELIRDYDRAYDYRAYTVNELESKLHELQASTSPAVSPAAAEPVAPPPPAGDSDSR